MTNDVRRSAQFRHLRTIADNARRRAESHATTCGRCYRASTGSGEACQHGRDLERDARQARRRAA